MSKSDKVLSQFSETAREIKKTRTNLTGKSVRLTKKSEASAQEGFAFYNVGFTDKGLILML